MRYETMIAGVVLALMVLGGGASFVQAQTPTEIQGCFEITWDPNAEPDLASYSLYVKKDGIAQPPKSIAAPQSEIPCDQVPIVEGSNYEIWLTASDTASNESPPSNALLVDWPDVTAPGTPNNICVNVTINGNPQQLCATFP